MHSKIAMSPFASMLPHLCENDNNFEIKLRIIGTSYGNQGTNDVRERKIIHHRP